MYPKTFIDNVSRPLSVGQNGLPPHEMRLEMKTPWGDVNCGYAVPGPFVPGVEHGS